MEKRLKTYRTEKNILPMRMMEYVVDLVSGIKHHD